MPEKPPANERTRSTTGRVTAPPSGANAHAGEVAQAAAKGVIWDWPLRLWHWAFAACIGFSLYSGLDGDIGLSQWHQRSGLALLGLLVFRFGWAAWGGRYARFHHYRVSPWTMPKALLDHFRGRAPATLAHTTPGTALAVLLALATTAQVGSGLFATDDIFNEGPLVALVSDEFARSASWVHRRLHWLILGAVSAHLAANAVYAIGLRDKTPLAMFTGRKPKAASLPSTPHFWVRAALTALAAAGAVLAAVYAERW